MPSVRWFIFWFSDNGFKTWQCSQFKHHRAAWAPSPVCARPSLLQVRRSLIKLTHPSGSSHSNNPESQESQETWLYLWVRKIPWRRKWQLSILAWKLPRRGVWWVQRVTNSQTRLTEQINQTNLINQKIPIPSNRSYEGRLLRGGVGVDQVCCVREHYPAKLPLG